MALDFSQLIATDRPVRRVMQGSQKAGVSSLTSIMLADVRARSLMRGLTGSGIATPSTLKE